MPIINYFHTIVLSGYWGKKQWQEWAQEHILSNHEIGEWIYKVAFAENEDELYMAIAYEKVAEVFDKSTLYDEAGVVIGYYYLMYIEGRMTLHELLTKLMDEDDVSGEAELFYKSETIQIIRNVMLDKCKEMELYELLMPLAKIAEKQLEVLENSKFNNVL